MPSNRRFIAFRPDVTEERLLLALVKRTGLPMARVLAVGLRRFAADEGLGATEDSDAGTEGVSRAGASA